MELDYIDSVELISTLKDKEKEQQIWDIWISLYPHMVLKQIKYISYEDYKDMLNGTGTYRRMTTAEIYEDVDSILEEFKTPEKVGE